MKLKILDVGSCDVNGTYKDLFPEELFEYQGLDMAPGPNVDIVPEFPYDWSEIETNSFDVVVSGQAFEHIEFFWLTFAEMTRVLRHGGLMAVVAPHGFGYHRYPVDCYRFYADGLVALAKYANMIPLHASTNAAPLGAPPQWYSQQEDDSFMIAKKPLSAEDYVIDKRKYKPVVTDMETLLTGFVTRGEQNY
jgi:SAM-dependent methyltransferase